MGEYNYEPRYKLGVAKVMGDALSRSPAKLSINKIRLQQFRTSTSSAHTKLDSPKENPKI